jgi:hypothetical protein
MEHKPVKLCCDNCGTTEECYHSTECPNCGYIGAKVPQKSRFKLIDTKRGGDQLGLCGCCNGKVDGNVFHLVEERQYFIDGIEKWSRYESISDFGHKECLNKLKLIQFYRRKREELLIMIGDEIARRMDELDIEVKEAQDGTL